MKAALTCEGLGLDDTSLSAFHPIRWGNISQCGASLPYDDGKGLGRVSYSTSDA